MCPIGPSQEMTTSVRIEQHEPNPFYVYYDVSGYSVIVILSVVYFTRVPSLRSSLQFYKCLVLEPLYNESLQEKLLYARRLLPDVVQ